MSEMINRTKYFSVFLAILFLLGCSSAENLSGDLQIEMTKYYIDSWLNLMPGTSPGTFHLTGDFTLKNNGTVEVDSVNLIKITTYADSQEVYTFKPVFRLKSGEVNYSLQPGDAKEFTFGTGQGLRINDLLMKYKRIDIKLELNTNRGEHYYKINNIEVVRAY
jgi:hypothetical protein